MQLKSCFVGSWNSSVPAGAHLFSSAQHTYMTTCLISQYTTAILVLPAELMTVFCQTLTCGTQEHVRTQFRSENVHFAGIHNNRPGFLRTHLTLFPFRNHLPNLEEQTPGESVFVVTQEGQHPGHSGEPSTDRLPEGQQDLSSKYMEEVARGGTVDNNPVAVV